MVSEEDFCNAEKAIDDFITALTLIKNKFHNKEMTTEADWQQPFSILQLNMDLFFKCRIDDDFYKEGIEE